MHCVRRAALRAVCSSSRFVAVPRHQVAAIAVQISKVNAQPTSALPLYRYFSQTAPVAEENEAPEAEQTDAPLQSSLTENERAIQNGHTIFISNMTFDATDVHLQEAFGKYGDILKVNIARDGRGLSRGFGFITFGTQDAADRAIQEANNSFWHGRRITVAPRHDGPSSTGPRNARPKLGPTNSVYIGNIPYEASDADLNQMFRSLDNCKDVRVAVDRATGWPRGFAHADFHTVEDAIKAYEKLQEYTLGGRQLRVDYAENRVSKRDNSSRQFE
ncbi:RNA-binding domain-containing protein [Nemania abortiva]|nr:RNA-binding domain-containing protein [Nemania abortiva]